MVSKRRLPPAKGNGNGVVTEINLEDGTVTVMPKLKKGDRARRLPKGPTGIVLKTERNRALMHWGTTSYPHGNGMVENRHEEWVPKIELERDLEPVVTDEEIARRMKQQSSGA